MSHYLGGRPVDVPWDTVIKAAAIDAAVKAVIDEGYRTGDIYTGCEGQKKVGTVEMGDAIVARIA